MHLQQILWLQGRIIVQIISKTTSYGLIIHILQTCELFLGILLCTLFIYLINYLKYLFGFICSRVLLFLLVSILFLTFIICVYVQSQSIILPIAYKYLKMIIDLTQKFKSLISEELQVSQCIPSLPIESQLCYKQAEDIRTSLQKILSILKENKQNYFSNAAYSYSAFTDQQRNEFDNEMKTLLDSVNIKVTETREVVEKLKFKNTTQKEHLKNMVICLYQQFKKISNVFKEFVEFNQNRKKKLQSMLGNQLKKEFKLAYSEKKQKKNNNPPSLVHKNSVDSELQEQSKQIFMQKMSEQKKIEQTMKKLTQISSILDVMQNKVLEQELLTSSFREIGQIGLFHIEKGNKNLVQANTLSKDSGRLWTMFFLFLAFSLLTLDYLKS